jgi:hypothetical protein
LFYSFECKHSSECKDEEDNHKEEEELDDIYYHLIDYLDQRPEELSHIECTHSSHPLYHHKDSSEVEYTSCLSSIHVLKERAKRDGGFEWLSNYVPFS